MQTIQSLDSLNEQIAQVFLSSQSDGHLNEDPTVAARWSHDCRYSMVLMRRLLIDAQGKFRQMMSDNKALASRIDQDIQYAHVQVSALRAELADTNQRIKDIRLADPAMAGNVITTCMPPTSTTNTAVVSNADGHWLKEVRSTYPVTDPKLKEARVMSPPPTIADKGGTVSPTGAKSVVDKSGNKSPTEGLYSPHHKSSNPFSHQNHKGNGVNGSTSSRKNDVDPRFTNEQNPTEATYGKISSNTGERPQVPFKQVGLGSKAKRDVLLVKDSSDKPDSLTESSEASEEISVSKHKSNRRERRSVKGSDVQKSLNDLKSQQEMSKLDDSSKSDLQISESDGNQNSAPECDLSISGSPFKEESSKIIDSGDLIISSLNSSPRNNESISNGSKGDDFSAEFHRSSPPVKDDSNAQCFSLLKESSDIHLPHRETTNGHRFKAKTKSDPLDKRRDKDAQEFSVLSSPSSVMRHKANVSKPQPGHCSWENGRFENKSSPISGGEWYGTRDDSSSLSVKSSMNQSSSKEDTSDSQDGIPSEFCDQRPIRNENQGGRYVVFDSKESRRPYQDWRTTLSESYRDQVPDPWVVNKNNGVEVNHAKSVDEKRQEPEKDGQSNSSMVQESSYLKKSTNLDYSSQNNAPKPQECESPCDLDTLRIKNSALLRDLEEVMESRDEKAKENAALASKMEHMEKELKHAKEALSALKQDRKRLKAEKFDLLTQMKQLYSTLEDKEAELREFIRNYEQKIKESDESIKQMTKDREEMEQEKWSILKRARDESERAVLLCTQLGLKDAHIKELQEEIATLQDKRISSNTDVRPSNGFGSPGSVSYRTANGIDSRGTTTPTPGSDPTTSPSYAGTPTTTSHYADPMMSPRRGLHVQQGLSPESHRPSLLSRSAEDIFNSEMLNSSTLGGTKKKAAKEKKGTWGSISRVFSRSKKRKPLDPDLFQGGSRCSWSPREYSGGLSEESYAQKLRLLEETHGTPMLHWRAATVLAWLEITMDMPQYGAMCAENIKSGKLLMELNDSELEEGLGITNVMHRRRLRLAIEEHRQPSLCRYPKLCLLTHSWVLDEWLPSIALPCYSAIFAEHLVDGRVLDTLTRKDLEKHFGVTRKFHQLSIMHAVQMLRMINFDRQHLHQRRMNSETMDIDPLVWTNQRLIKWAASIDLAEYADNLRNTGVHGALAVLEPSFTADTIATALGIPTSKNIIRRHLTTEWQNLIQPARLSLESECMVSKKCSKSEKRLASGSSSISLVSQGRSGSSTMVHGAGSYARRTLDRYDRRRSSWRESLRSLTSRKAPSLQTTTSVERPHVLQLSPKLNSTRHRRTFSSHSDVETLTVTPV
ncbi:hypothetical protein JTE90_000111 [Oedothorax gibbosus]|uniref:SAM domain-containing protein n=2 Tax=Oedothorax gibbosus TaxID=931172 RepID=A0AAV6V2E2_9ARAC|nr:hypothetical protein JTE90_000111 [Oedothorax gibbosus]